MFTGLVQHVGGVASREASAAGVRLRVDAAGWAHSPALGDSISVQGVCLTVAQNPRGGVLEFDVVAQTLARTTLGGLHAGDKVNLEHAATMSTLLGGHLVQGHVDGVGRVLSVSKGNEWRVRVGVNGALARYLAPQGSVCVDGVSLTVAGLSESSASEAWFEVALIPTTLEKTTLRGLREGDGVNIECDAIAKQVVAWCERCGVSGGKP